MTSRPSFIRLESTEASSILHDAELKREMSLIPTQTDRELRLTELLQRYGIGAQRARKNARTELLRWDPVDVEPILRQINFGGRDHNPCGRDFNIYTELGIGKKLFMYGIVGFGLACAVPILVVHSSLRFLKHWKVSVFKQTWDEYNLSSLVSLASEVDGYIKAPRRLIEQSIQDNAALCVNRDGKLKLMTSNYAVMSHVWEETMGWNSPSGFGKVDLSLRKKGIHRGHFLKFFDRCGADWLWVDAIAMPEILEDMSEVEQRETEGLRVGVINNFANICRNANKTVILDSLVMQLSTGSLVDVAVVLCLGRWVTRMWTVTEARLGNRVLIKTQDGETNLDDIISTLGDIATDPSHRYFDIVKTLYTIRRDVESRDDGHRLGELAEAYCYANTGEDIDTVRAAYPLIGLTWQAGWTREEGMRFLISILSDDSPALAGLCGERGMHEPYSWVPLKLNNLLGRPSPTLQLAEDGVRGGWKTISVSGIHLNRGSGRLGDPMVLDFAVMGEDGPKVLSTQLLTMYPLATLERKVADGKLKLVYPEMEPQMSSFVIAFADQSPSEETPDQPLTGTIAGSGLIQSRGAGGEVHWIVKWLLL